MPVFLARSECIAGFWWVVTYDISDPENWVEIPPRRATNQPCDEVPATIAVANLDYESASQAFARIVDDVMARTTAVDEVARPTTLEELLRTSGLTRVSSSALRRALEHIDTFETLASDRETEDEARQQVFFSETKNEGTTEGTSHIGAPDLGTPDGKVKVGDPPNEEEVGQVLVKSDVKVKYDQLTYPDSGGPPQKKGGITHPRLFTVEYIPRAGAECNWLQFYWVELKYGVGGAAPVRKSEQLDGANGKYPTTETPPPSHPGLRVDVWGTQLSIYPDDMQNGWHLGPGDTPMSGFGDSPEGDINDDNIRKWTRKWGVPTKIEEILHFEDFLICNGSVIYKVNIDVVFVWESATRLKTHRVENVRGEKCPSLDPAHQEAIRRQYPNFNPANGKPL